jgi:predicted SnoaL-like aldol condensation-catalyzing enzyme
MQSDLFNLAVFNARLNTIIFKKEKVITFLKLAAGGDLQAAFIRFIAPNFIHHNQYFEGKRESLLKAMEEAHQTSPNKSIEIKNCYSEGDTVVTHSLVVKEEMEVAVVHIFRYENDHIVELWDLGKVAEKNSPNENGLF